MAKGKRVPASFSAFCSASNLQLGPEGPWQWQGQEVRAQPGTGLHILQTKQTVTEGDAHKNDNSEASSSPLGNHGSLSLLVT